MNEIIFPVSGEYEGLCRDESRSEGYADTVSFPEDEACAAEILRALHEQKIPVTVQGGRTGLAAGAVPYGGHMMNLSKMNHFLGLRKAGSRFYLRLQPGVVLSVLNKAISERDIPHDGWSEESLDALALFEKSEEFFFPTDPTETSATIGGMAACGASGARSYRYGSVRPYISALHVLLSDGDMIDLARGEVFAEGRTVRISTEGGRTVTAELPSYQMPDTKNASGYFVADGMDAVDIFIGSDGTLGVITEIEVMLLPLPKVIMGVSCFTDSEAQAVLLTKAVREDLCNIAAIEYFDGGALDILREQKKNSTAFSELPDVDETAGCCVYFEIHCDSDADAKAAAYRIGDHMRAIGADEAKTWVAATDSDRERLKFFRHAVPESVNMLIDERKKKDHTITKLGADMSVPDECLEAVMAMYRAGIAGHGLHTAIWGHIGDNHLHVNVLPRDGEEYRKGKELFKLWAAKVTEMGGAVSAEHGVGKIKRDFLEVMYGREHVIEMAQMKLAFDPEFTFGRGNLFPEDILGKNRE